MNTLLAQFCVVTRAIRWIPILGAVVHAQARPVRTPSRSFAFTHVSVVDVERGQLNHDYTVVVSGNRITVVGLTVRIPAGARVMNARGKFLIPGLWDMHSHSLAYVGAASAGLRSVQTRLVPPVAYRCTERQVGIMTISSLRPLLGLVLVLACGGAAAATATSPTANANDVDADGVQMLFPSAPGASFRLGNGNPNATARLVVEQGTATTAGTDGGIRFWNLPAYPLNYSSGGTGLTSRLHIQASGAAQQFSWRTQRGYLSAANDLRNQEFTVYVRAHGMIDSSRAMVTMKVRGGGHSANNGDLASCVMMTLAPANAPGGATRFGKEIVHPDYDYVRLTPRFDASLVENQWVGIKMVSWNDPADSTRVINRLYLDTDPFEKATGKPRNNWRLFSEYLDVPGKSTGRYNTAVTWGGWQTTVRTDGYRSMDFTLLSAREIVPPR